MQKLAAMDASFLYSETNRTNSNIGSVQLLELPEGISEREFISSLKDYIKARAHRVPFMTRKLAFVPGNFDHPVWVRAADFDIDQHIIELPVAAPGGRAEMEAAVTAVHEQKMALDRPLWMMYVLTGLASGHVAYYNLFHHCNIDGASGNMALDQLMDDTPDHPVVESAPELAEDEAKAEADLKRRPALTLVEQAFGNFLRYQLEAGQRLSGSLDTTRRLIQRAIDPTQDFGAFGKVAPSTPFNDDISAKRLWSTTEMPLADIKQIGKKVGATVNDVFMAICAGGLRSYLERRGELPEDSLIAGCPVSLRKPGDTSNSNQVTMMLVELATQTSDPVERIKAIVASSHVAKGVTADLAGAYDNNAALPGLPALMQAQMNAQESMGLARFFRSPINVVISNVPGPRKTLYSNGARMVTHYPISIATHGVGLNITVQSYVDQMYVGLTACARAVPDLETLRDDMIAAFEELRFRLLPTNVSELRPRLAPRKAVNPVTDAVIDTTLVNDSHNDGHSDSQVA